MSSRPRTRYLDLALILAALSLGTYIAATSGGPTSDEVLARENNLFPAFSPATIRTVTLLANGSNVTLRRVEEDPDPHLFFLGPTGQMPADPAVIAELFSTLEYATWLRTLASDETHDLAKMGFETPRLELKLNAGARSYRLLFGAMAPFPDGSIYARVHENSGDAVTGVVPEQLLTKLLRGEQEFRGSSLFLYGRSETNSLSITKANERLELQADALGFLAQQINGQSIGKIRAERSLTDLIFFQMARASITNFVTPELAKEQIAADPERLTVQQNSNDAPAVTVQIGGPCPNDKHSVLAIRLTPDVIAGCVTRTILPALRLSPRAMIDLSAAPLTVDEIDHVIIRDTRDGEKHASKIDLIRSEDAFSLLSRKSERVELNVGQEFLEVLSTGVLEQIEGKPAAVTQTGDIVIKGQSLANGSQSVSDSSHETNEDPLVQELHLELFRASSSAAQKDLWLHRLDDDVWLKIPEPLMWAFEADDIWAKDRHLLHAERDQISEVTLKSARGWTQTLRSDGSVTSSERAEPIPADPLLSRRLLDEIAHLEAVRFVSKALPKESPDIEITFSLTDSSKQLEPAGKHTIWIGKRTRGGYLAWSNFVDGLFVLSLPTQAIFDTPLGTRAPLQIDLASIVRLNATAADRSYHFERRGEGLHPSGGGAVEDMVAPLEEALRSFDVVARTMNHPGARSLSRGDARLSLQIELKSGEKFTIHVGAPGEWQGLNVNVAWREGETENYVIGKNSLDALLSLL